jgi:hypothetical protein
MTILRIVTIAALPAGIGAPVAAQERADSGRAVCFGVSFDRGCRFMVQYEAGYRAAAAGRGPRLVLARQRPRSDRSQLFVAGGLMWATSPVTTLGAVYERGTGDEQGTQALGIRWGRQLRATNRIDLTAGVVLLPLVGDSVVPSRAATSRGAFAELALHGGNALTLIVRDETYASRSHATSGNLLFAGARAEAAPAAILTLAAAALVGLAVAAAGPDW